MEVSKFAARSRGPNVDPVRCEVLDRKQHRLLRYSWVGGAETNDAYGSRLDSVVTWTLTPVAGGTRVHMEHTGFRSPGNDFAYDAMGSGWRQVLERIEQMIRVDG